MMAGFSISDDDVDKALDAIARTPAGYAFYCGLNKTALTLPGEDDPSRGALRANFARRKFALELMMKMAKGIDESHGRADPTDRPTGRPLVFRPREPAAVAKRTSIAERLLAEFPHDPTVGT
jgi:hypothetical protein